MAEDYRAIAQEIAEDIDAGRLQPGDRLPPQRQFAWRRGIAPSTASRVYAELTRRGLIVGEVGRGSFIRSAPPADHPTLAEPPALPINLETNYPILPDQHAILASILRQIAANPEVIQRILRETSVRATITTRDSVAKVMHWQGWRAQANQLLFAGNGRQALAATLSALARPGERIGFETMTYPMAKTIAAKLGLVAVPLAMDEQGLIPEAVEAAYRAAPLRAIYVQPTVHNPLGITMPAPRRAALAKMLQSLESVVAIEDAIYAFLDADAPPPLVSFAPDHTILLDAMSKRLGPGLTLAFVVAPPPWIEPISLSFMSGGWGPSGFALEVCLRLLLDGGMAALEQAKRVDAQIRQAEAANALSGLTWQAHPSSYHLMIDLPEGQRAETLVAAAKAQGIAITPASAFAVQAAHAPNAVRIGLANLAPEVIGAVLGKIARLIG
ncbi:PLP-dependent aminotransferase family protein [Novosphingobium umbonatum]|uniref:PLP-dependent aminotransferase family protein n=1 Tax=Novosphingobium umbonatum TaxID=1908524 RepID=A0A437MX17_9SPHN|nr:PLP-dependent aminotransferase family protein [Novosphingobium umbonatum]RVU02211.1 PLP-dependent aminotransferase family protein [Novosphingobium umbonatum]